MNARDKLVQTLLFNSATGVIFRKSLNDLINEEMTSQRKKQRPWKISSNN